VRIDGPVDDQRAIRFAIFHLIQSTSVFDASVGTAAKGLTGPGYKGHVFWDTEVFMLPFFLGTDPRTARRLLEYRYLTLVGARKNARGAGYEGAMIAWESTETGEETCPPFVPDPKTGEPVRVLTGEMEHHISADVAYGAWLYLRSSNDLRFRRYRYRELLFETARFWASRVSLNEGKECYEISAVIGPDEYHENVDNNVFTNWMAAWNLTTAAEEARTMRRQAGQTKPPAALLASRDEAARWREIASQLYIPPLGKDLLREQHDGFFRLRRADPETLTSRNSKLTEKARMSRIAGSQVLKQADAVMVYMLFPDRFSLEEKTANFDFYEPRTTHDSSLSPSVHSIVASDLGRHQQAYRYFRQSAYLDLHDRMGNTAQGLHCACLGGTWQSVIRGFLGIRLEEQELSLRPRLPRVWKGVNTQIRHRGRWYVVEVRGSRANLRRSADPRVRRLSGAQSGETVATSS
jgi:trehalose/maltose hydrolase-like predicted phosphorylase